MIKRFSINKFIVYKKKFIYKKFIKKKTRITTKKVKTSTKKITWKKTHRYRVVSFLNQKRQSIDQRINSFSKFEKSFHENSFLFERYERILKRIVNRFLKYICTKRIRSTKVTNVFVRRLLVYVVENFFFHVFFFFIKYFFYNYISFWIFENFRQNCITTTRDFIQIEIQNNFFAFKFDDVNFDIFQFIEKSDDQSMRFIFFLKNFVFFFELFNVNQRFIEINVNLNRNSLYVF